MAFSLIYDFFHISMGSTDYVKKTCDITLIILRVQLLGKSQDNVFKRAFPMLSSNGTQIQTQT